MKTPAFRTAYVHGEDHYRAPIGAKIEYRHRAKMKTDGKRVLIKDQEYPIYEIIQAHREETEIERIVKRATEGDISALNAMNGVYADITDAPRSLAEAQALIIDAKNEFEKMPTEIKEKFNNNSEEYVAEMGSKIWMDKMGITAELERIKNPTTETITPAELPEAGGTPINNIGGEADA